MTNPNDALKAAVKRGVVRHGAVVEIPAVRQSRVLNTDLLIEFNRRSVARKFHNVLSSKLITLLDPVGVHVVSFHMLHDTGGKISVRTRLLCKLSGTERPEEVWFDFRPEDFHNVPMMDVPAHE